MERADLVKRNSTVSERSLERELRAEEGKKKLRNELESEIEASIVLLQKKEIGDIVQDKYCMKIAIIDLSPKISYSFLEEELMMSLQYNAPALDYEKAWYGESKVNSAEYVHDIEYLFEVPTDTESDMLTIQEAAVTFMDIQYSTMLGDGAAVNSEERRKLDWWIKSDPALFKLLESLHGLTRDVNYAVM